MTFAEGQNSFGLKLGDSSVYTSAKAIQLYGGEVRQLARHISDSCLGFLILDHPSQMRRVFDALIKHLKNKPTNLYTHNSS